MMIKQIIVNLCLLFFTIRHSQEQASESQRILEPPKITMPNTAMKLVEAQNSLISQQCRATGRPQPRYMWFLDGVRLETNEKKRIEIDEVNGYLRLRLRYVESLPENSNNGTYYCHAFNEIDDQTIVDISLPFVVNVIRSGGWGSDAIEEVTSVDEGDYVRLAESNWPDVVGEFKYLWFTRGESIESLLKANDRIFIDKTGDLHFVYALSGDSTSYIPSIEVKDVITSPQREQIIQLTVNDGGPMTSQDPVLQHFTQDAAYTVGETAQLECLISGYQLDGEEITVVNIIWTNEQGNRVGHVGDKYVAKQHGRILMVNTVTESDEQIFHCTGSNSEGSADGSVFLDYKSIPIWIQPFLRDQTMVAGSDAVFACKARSPRDETPPRHRNWMKNGSPLDASGKYVFSGPDREILTVKNVSKPDDIACFQCGMENDVGSNQQSVCLNVILPITITQRPDHLTVEVEEGDVVDLTVLASGDPLYELVEQWEIVNSTHSRYFTDGTVPPFVERQEDRQSVYRYFIDTANMTSAQLKAIEGTYIRHFANRIVDTSVSIKVTLAPLPVVKEAGFPIWIIIVILAVIVVIAVIIVVSFVMFDRKRQEGEYSVDKLETDAGLNPKKETKNMGFVDLSRAPDDNFTVCKGKFELLDPEVEAEVMEYKDESFEEYDTDLGLGCFDEDGSFIAKYIRKQNSGPACDQVVNGPLTSDFHGDITTHPSQSSPESAV